MKLIMENWKRFLKETTNKEFLDEFAPLYEKWLELQTGYGPINMPYYDDPETGERQPLPQQEVPIEDQPEYVKLHPKYYSTLVGHPSERRASFSQTEKEVEIEKELLSLFQKYADQSSFRNDFTIYHNLNYVADIQKPAFEADLKFSDFSREDYLGMEGKRGKDVLSCHATTGENIRGGYGMILQGHVIFASIGDLRSQTFRTAHEKIRQKHTSSGVPKRTSPGEVYKPTNPRQEKFLKKMGKTEEEIKAAENLVVLSSDDLPSGSAIEELLLGNWEIVGWFCRGIEDKLIPEKFWKKAYEIGIKEPVYLLSASGEKKEISLKDYYS